MSARPSADGFRRNLAWSGAAHLFLLGGAFVAVGLERDAGFAPPSAAFIELGMSGPNPNPGLGSPAPAPPPAAPDPEPAPPEEPPPPEESPSEPPGLVRPTVEDRDRMPVPEARERRSEPVKRPESGLRGADAAWADSDRLASPAEPAPPAVDTKSRPARRASAANRSGSGAGGIGLGGAPGGARFDQDFEYSFYQRQMIARIQAHWQQIPVRGQTQVVIRFTIFRDGTISGAEVENSSGRELLDRAALRAVVLAEPFPRLPESYPRDRVGVHLLFTYGEAGGDLL